MISLVHNLKKKISIDNNNGAIRPQYWKLLSNITQESVYGDGESVLKGIAQGLMLIHADLSKEVESVFFEKRSLQRNCMIVRSTMSNHA